MNIDSFEEIVSKHLNVIIEYNLHKAYYETVLDYLTSVYGSHPDFS